MGKIKFNYYQLRIMQVIWEKKRISAQDITRAINKIEPLVHNTVQSHLRKLEERGAIAHDVEGRTFMYYPLVEQEKIMKSRMSELIEFFFAGSAESMVSYLANNKYISLDETKKLLKLLDDKGK